MTRFLDNVYPIKIPLAIISFHHPKYNTTLLTNEFR